jgi:hypothetical protein
MASEELVAEMLRSLSDVEGYVKAGKAAALVVMTVDEKGVMRDRVVHFGAAAVIPLLGAVALLSRGIADRAHSFNEEACEMSWREEGAK